MATPFAVSRAWSLVRMSVTAGVPEDCYLFVAMDARGSWEPLPLWRKLMRMDASDRRHQD